MRVLIIVALILSTGCGTRNYKEFDFSNVHESQGVIIGKVDVEYNSKPFDITWCKFCAGTACHHLLEDGYVFMPVGKGPLTEGRFSCAYPDVCCTDILFTVDSFEVTPTITYFGNLMFIVNIESFSNCVDPVPVKADPLEDYNNSYRERRRRGEVKSRFDALAKDAIDGLLSAMFSPDETPKQRVQYNISFDVSVEDRMAKVMEVFRRQVNKDDVEIEKNLLSIKLDRKEKAFHRDC